LKETNDILKEPNDILNGANDISNGANDISDGANDILNGANDILNGANDISDGANDISDGANDIFARGLMLISFNISGTYLPRGHRLAIRWCSLDKAVIDNNLTGFLIRSLTACLLRYRILGGCLQRSWE